MGSLTVNREPINYSAVPAPHMAGSVQRYLENGIPGGSFLMAVVSGDLFEAARRADDVNRRLLWEWCFWFYNYAPSGSFGSPEIAKRWMRERRAAQEKGADA